MAKFKRKGVSGKLRFAVFRRDRFRCVYCGANGPRTQLQLDHLKPVAAGGDDSYWNLLTACAECNNAKSDDPARFDVLSYREELRCRNIAEFFPTISKDALAPDHQAAWKGGHATDPIIEECFVNADSTAKFLFEFKFIPDPYEVKTGEWLDIYFSFMRWVAQTYLDVRAEFFPGKAPGDPVTAADRVIPARLRNDAKGNQA